MLFLPPGSAKSTYASVLFPAWYFAQNPKNTIIAASHTGELAQRFGRHVRNLVSINSSTLGYSLAEDNKAAGRWETNSGGEYFAAGVGGAITGRRADLAIIDDPVKSREEAESQTVREKIIDWYRADLYTRLKPGAAIVLIMTRWHEEDLGGYLLGEMEKGGDCWRVLKLPALANATDDPLGREIGEALWPEWEDADAIARKRQTLGEREFGALYQQDPRPAGTSFFLVENVLVDGQPVDPPKGCDFIFATLDTAVKTGSKNDGTAIAYWMRSKYLGHPLVLLDWEILQIEGSLLEAWLPSVYVRLEELVVQYSARGGSIGVFIEDKASGSILIQQAIRRSWPVIAIDSKLTSVGKDERAISISGYVHSQQVKICRHAYEKVTNYKGKNGNHLLIQVFRYQLGVPDQADDLLDAFCYGVALALGNSGGF